MSDVPSAGWRPLPDGIAKLTTSGQNGVSLDIGSVRFAPTSDADALGALAFAYGLDSGELFGLHNVLNDGMRYVAWHFCALISTKQDDPGLAAMVSRGLAAALELAPTQEARVEVQRRFGERYELVVQAVAQGAKASSSEQDKLLGS